MNAVLEWIKANLATVIFLVLMIAALVTLPIVAGNLNEGVREMVKKRADTLTEIRKLNKTSVTIPTRSGPISESVLVNRQLLDRLVQLSAEQKEDADQVRAAALAHNRKDRGVLMPRLLPEPPPAEREVLPSQFHEIVLDAYRQLLGSVRAGSPPSAEEMLATLQEQRARFLTQTLQKDEADPLSAEEALQLRESLSQQRMSEYAEAAERIGIYARIEVLRPPIWDQTHQPTMSELFEWQWQYWIIEDVLNALYEANGPDASVIQAPAKRVLDLVVYEGDFGGGGGSGGGMPGAGPGGSAPGSAMGGRRGGGSGAPAGPPPGKPANPALEVKLDYAQSLTGRVTNPLYDVRHLRLEVVVDTARMPEVLDALARRNFITVLDLDMRPADHYSAARQGYFYGSAPVSILTLQLETVWLRGWTTEFMPEEILLAMGAVRENTP